MPRIEIDPTIDDSIVIVIGDIELKVKDDFSLRDQEAFTEIEQNLMDSQIPKKQLMLLFGLTERQIEEIAKKIPYKFLKKALTEAYMELNNANFMEKKTQELKSLKSLPLSPDSSAMSKSKESSQTMKKE